MNLLIVSAAAVVVGFIIFLRTRNDMDVPEWLTGAGMLLGIVGLICGLVFGAAAAHTQITKEAEYQKALYMRDVLIYRLENENMAGNELLYSQIVEFNNDLRDIKRWSANEWVGIFNNDMIAGIDYIEIPGMEGMW